MDPELKGVRFTGLHPVKPAVKIDRFQVHAEIVVADPAHVIPGKLIFFVDVDKIAVLTK